MASVQGAVELTQTFPTGLASVPRNGRREKINHRTRANEYSVAALLLARLGLRDNLGNFLL